jgi:hypothetical protein
MSDFLCADAFCTNAATYVRRPRPVGSVCVEGLSKGALASKVGRLRDRSLVLSFSFFAKMKSS